MPKKFDVQTSSPWDMTPPILGHTESGRPIYPIAGGDGGTESNIALDEPAVIDKRLDSRSHTQPVSTLVVHREVLSIGDPTTDARIADVTNADPVSTDDGLVVRDPRGTTVALAAFTDPIDRAARDLGKVDVALLDQYTPIDVDTGAGVLNALPVTWRKASALGVEFGTAADPVRIDPTGTTTQPISAASLPLPTGAATAAAQLPAGHTVDPTDRAARLLGATDVAVANAADPTRVEGANVRLRTTLVGDLAITLSGEAVVLGAGAANIGDVDVLTTPKSSTVTAHAQTAVGTVGVSLLAANTARKQVMVHNTGTTTIKLSLTTTDPTQTSYHLALKAGTAADDGLGGTYISDLWQGVVRAISSAAGGTVVVAEIT